MSSTEAELMKAHLQVYILESRRNSQYMADMMDLLMAVFPTQAPDIQEVILEALDEFAQESVRKRELFDNTIAAMKKVQAESNE